MARRAFSFVCIFATTAACTSASSQDSPGAEGGAADLGHGGAGALKTGGGGASSSGSSAVGGGGASGANGLGGEGGGEALVSTCWDTTATMWVATTGSDAANPIRFIETPSPTREQVASVLERVEAGILRYLKRRHLIDNRAAEDRSNEQPEPTAIEGVTSLSLFGKSDFIARPFALSDRNADERALEVREPRFSGERNRFNLHCAVTVRADDDEGREKLLRYCARPPFALERIEELPDDRIAYRVKTVRKGRTHRIMTPVEFLARLAAVLPPPRYPLVRYGGVFASASKWRKLVVPRPPEQHVPKATSPTANAEGRPSPLLPSEVSEVGAMRVRPEVDEYPGCITLKHWKRVGNGALFATSRDIPWRVLMARTFGFDVLACPKCGNTMRVRGIVEDKDEARRQLQELGIELDEARPVRTRDPTFVQTDFSFDFGP